MKKIILDALYEQNKYLNEKYNALLEHQLQNETIKSKLFSSLDELKILKLDNQNNIVKIKENVSKLNSDSIEPIKETELKDLIINYTEELSKGFNKENNSLTNIIEIIKKSINSGSNSNFTIIDDYKEYLSTLSLEQTGALANISCAIVIFFCLITLISIFFSDILLKYFNLENKYPKLARFILIRREFQKYYFILNSLIILIVLLAIIFINILSFF